MAQCVCNGSRLIAGVPPEFRVTMSFSDGEDELFSDGEYPSDLSTESEAGFSSEENDEYEFDLEDVKFSVLEAGELVWTSGAFTCEGRDLCIITKKDDKSKTVSLCEMNADTDSVELPGFTAADVTRLTQSELVEVSRSLSRKLVRRLVSATDSFGHQFRGVVKRLNLPNSVVVERLFDENNFPYADHDRPTTEVGLHCFKILSPEATAAVNRDVEERTITIHYSVDSGRVAEVFRIEPLVDRFEAKYTIKSTTEFYYMVTSNIDGRKMRCRSVKAGERTLDFAWETDVLDIYTTIDLSQSPPELRLLHLHVPGNLTEIEFSVVTEGQSEKVTEPALPKKGQFQIRVRHGHIQSVQYGLQYSKSDVSDGSSQAVSVRYRQHDAPAVNSLVHIVDNFGIEYVGILKVLSKGMNSITGEREPFENSSLGIYPTIPSCPTRGVVSTVELPGWVAVQVLRQGQDFCFFTEDVEHYRCFNVCSLDVVPDVQIEQLRPLLVQYLLNFHTTLHSECSAIGHTIDTNADLDITKYHDKLTKLKSKAASLQQEVFILVTGSHPLQQISPCNDFETTSLPHDVEQLVNEIETHFRRLAACARERRFANAAPTMP